MNKKLKGYCASGWFSPNQREVLDFLEDILRKHPNVNPYFPRHDGVKLTPDEFHDTELRMKVFLDNIKNIKESDFVLAACDGRDGVYDTGTQWEIGYAMAHNIPVIAYDTTDNIYSTMKSIVKGFYSVCHDMESLQSTLDLLISSKEQVQNKIPSKILFVGPDDTEEQRETNKNIVSSVILECHGVNFKWVDDLSKEEIIGHVEEIFEDVDYMIAVIDDRHPIVSWLMSQAYSRGIPIITYTNFDYGINLMLGMSIHYHCKGKESLKEIMQKMKREGIYSLDKYDSSELKMQ